MDALIQELKEYIKRVKKKIITETRNSTDNIMINGTTIRKQKRQKKNNLDISSDKLMKSHMRKTGHGKEREILREKLNLF